MNAMLTDFPNPLTNGRIVAQRVKTEDYLRQEPGVKRGDPAFVMSRTDLFTFAHCPKRWVDGYQHEDTDATEWGSLMDCLVTHPWTFKDEYVVQPETVTATKTMECVKSGAANEGDKVPWSGQSKEAKEWTAAQKKAGKLILTREENAAAGDALAAIRRDEKAASLLDASAFQVLITAEYHCAELGIVVPLKTLVDILPTEESTQWNQYMADFKTARSAAPRAWDKVVYERAYHWQAAMEVDAYSVTPEGIGKTPRCFLHLIQENYKPFQIGRRWLNLQWMGLGRSAYTEALRRYCQCLKTGIWPSWDDVEIPGRMNLNGWTESQPESYMINQ